MKLYWQKHYPLRAKKKKKRRQIKIKNKNKQKTLGFQLSAVENQAEKSNMDSFLRERNFFLAERTWIKENLDKYNDELGNCSRGTKLSPHQ